MKILFSERSNLFAIRIAALAYVLFMAFFGILRNGFNSDLLLLALLLGAWFLIAALLSGFQRRLNWHERTTCLLACAMDGYFLMTSLNLAAASSYTALLALAAFCFAVAFTIGPALVVTSFLTGLIGFVSAYLVTASSSRPSILNMIGVPLLGALCGLAWRIVVPMLWKAIQIIAADPDAVNRGVAPGLAGAAPTPEATAALAVLEEEKARLTADLENVRAEVDMLKILSAKRQKSFEVAEKEKQEIKAELETAQKEMEKMFGMDAPAPVQEAASADITAAAQSPDQQAQVAELEKELAAARTRLEQVESEKQALAAELEKTNAELMKAYGA